VEVSMTRIAPKTTSTMMKGAGIEYTFLAKAAIEAIGFQIGGSFVRMGG